MKLPNKVTGSLSCRVALETVWTTHLPRRWSGSVYTPVPDSLWWGLFLGLRISELLSAFHRHRAALQCWGTGVFPRAQGRRCWQLEGAGFGRSGMDTVVSATGCQVWLLLSFLFLTQDSPITQLLWYFRTWMKRQSELVLCFWEPLSPTVWIKAVLGEKGGQHTKRNKPEWRSALCWVLNHDSSCLEIQLKSFSLSLSEFRLLLKLLELVFFQTQMNSD